LTFDQTISIGLKSGEYGGQVQQHGAGGRDQRLDARLLVAAQVVHHDHVAHLQHRHVMAIVQAVLHAHPDGIDGPAALLTHANRQLCDKHIGGFFTAFLGVYDPASRRLTYANAGHPGPLVKRASTNRIESLDAVVRFPLGIEATETFAETTVSLEPNDMILLYTDGITEARRSRDDWFGREGLARVMGNTRGGPAELIDHLRTAVREYQQHRPPAPDDQTLVAALVL
jgi:sigma-B regulation protein RsbU (phosphoserine phosphatase)